MFLSSSSVVNIFLCSQQSQRNPCGSFLEADRPENDGDEASCVSGRYPLAAESRLSMKLPFHELADETLGRALPSDCKLKLLLLPLER